MGKQDSHSFKPEDESLKRSHDDPDNEVVNGNGQVEEDIVSQDEEGGMELDAGSSVGASGDEISIGDNSDADMVEEEAATVLPKRQKLS